MMPLLQIESLCVSLAGRSVLEGVTLSLAAGEVVALIGANGSGKTTLLRAALGHIASSGTITWDGRLLGEISRRQLAKTAAYLPQTPTTEAGDLVIDTLRLGRAPFQSAFGIEGVEDEAVVHAVATELELGELLTRSIETLSGGQRQRVLLGRCLVQSPRALLLDEPATFLDLRHQVDLHRMLRGLANEKQIGVLMASHDLNLAARHSDRIIVLKGGRVLAQGATGEVLNETLLSKAFDVEMRSAVIDDRRQFFV